MKDKVYSVAATKREEMKMSMGSRVNPHKVRVKIYCGNQENIWYDENNYDKDLELEQYFLR